MNYDIKIKSESLHNGQIEFERLNNFSDTIEKQIESQLNAKKMKNTFGELVGKWPGNENWKDIIKDLD
ncbi:MAG: hypothetical protein A2275_12415 [Bacteroidetes bacterium RIFOXYA12_FULL_35_11]|nr:MAG: hypothetical protein A2X01_02470 [Bacteroidetes bacterium GWF2_35_48]OFY77882.1 MAG: hypothetical protein A2275_12415 [Bacteroidetes bacterium RIFOXYA12_FULL_35_11]OFY96028.1 MAG: hypothetical protein A2491_06015 [Bacteroidetes bacterium RIFOXYC12_FULL_35_7]HBX50354.1 hypothetical protein [Bacteroidales bacterium]